MLLGAAAVAIELRESSAGLAIYRLRRAQRDPNCKHTTSVWSESFETIAQRRAQVASSRGTGGSNLGSFDEVMAGRACWIWGH
jgi:hypothetical protein